MSIFRITQLDHVLELFSIILSVGSLENAVNVYKKITRGHI